MRRFLEGNANPLNERASDEELDLAGYGFYHSGIMEELAATVIMGQRVPSWVASVTTGSAPSSPIRQVSSTFQVSALGFQATTPLCGSRVSEP